MNIIRILYHTMRADYLERTRRYNFLISLGFMLIAVYYMIPPLNASYITTDLGNYRGIYDSAWIGCNVALFSNILLAMAGFYLVKNTIERDQQTRVGQIIASTSLRKIFYIFGKALSNFAVLATMVLLIVVAAIVLQLIRGEDLHIALGQLLSPFLWLTLPAIAVIAAAALLFETISFFKGGFGNVIYYFLLIYLMTLPVIAFIDAAPGKYQPKNDLVGISIPMYSLTNAGYQMIPGFKGVVTFGIKPAGAVPRPTFHWEGIRWTPGMIGKRLWWYLVALGITLLAVLFFRNFDPALKKHKHQLSFNWLKRPAPKQVTSLPVQTSPDKLTAVAYSFNFFRMVLAELRLGIKDLPWWWWVGISGLFIASLFNPLESAWRELLPFLWLLPITIWSGIGVRENYYNTRQLVFTGPYSFYFQPLAAWLAGFTVALASGSGILIRLFIAGNWPGVGGLLVGVLFIPTLALALGVFSKSRKVFEVIYVYIWISGLLDHVAYLDFAGISRNAISQRIPVVYLILSGLMLGIVLLGRRREIQV